MDDNIPPIMLYRTQLSRSILNVLKNAQEAVPNGGDIAVNISCDDTLVTITIQDNGPGMTEQVMEKIFDPFFTTKDHGTGLGLSYTHMIIEKHGGTIRVDSQQGHGTKFIISLPAGKYVHQT